MATRAVCTAALLGTWLIHNMENDDVVRVNQRLGSAALLLDYSFDLFGCSTVFPIVCPERMSFLSFRQQLLRKELD